MGLLTFYLLGVTLEAAILAFIFHKDLKTDPAMEFTVADLLISVFISLFSWFLVLVALGEGFKYLMNEFSVPEKVKNFLNKDLRK